jgi:hypothetical protein
MTRRQDITPKFPDLGKLRKGGPKTDPKRPGPDLDHWRFTSERQDVQRAFDAAYGGKPALIEAYLPFATLEQNWNTWFEEYDHGGMVHRCDGQTMNRWRTANGDYADGERPCPYYTGTKTRAKDNPGCKQVGRLSMIVPQLIRAGFVGFVTMETHSINDLVSITACLLDAETKAGHLNGILFNVLRVKQSISTPAWKDEDKAAGRRNRTIKDLVKIVPAAEWVLARMQVEAEEQMALAAGQPLQLTARHVDDADDDDDYDDDDEDLAEEEPPPVAASKPPPATEPPLSDAEAEFHAMTSATVERSAAPKPHGGGQMADMEGKAAHAFAQWCEVFVQVFPYYRKDGKADMPHLLRAVYAENFRKVTTENLEAVCVALEKRAEAKVAGKEIVGK